MKNRKVNSNSSKSQNHNTIKQTNKKKEVKENLTSTSDKISEELLKIAKENNEFIKNNENLNEFNVNIDKPAKVKKIIIRNKKLKFLLEFKERADGITPLPKILENNFVKKHFTQFLIDYYQSKIKKVDSEVKVNE